MRFKDILVHIDNRPSCATRLTAAIHLAVSQGARLSGIYVLSHSFYTPDGQNAQTLEMQARKNFEAASAAAGLEGDWLSVDCQQTGLTLPQALNLHTHYRDLLVVSQNDPERTIRNIPANLPEKAVLGSGRPVLIVPYAGEFSSFGKRVMIAWRGGPESSRAVHDAMPLLRAAEMVQVMTIRGRHGDESFEHHNADICAHLKRYGLTVSTEKHVGDDLSVGDILLNRCADGGIDLLVVGAFSQSRRGYQTLGEVGRHLLKFMTVPVLMSH